MKEKINIERKLDLLLEKAKHDFLGIEPLVALYSDCASQSNLTLIKNYGEKIQLVCSKWEKDYKDAKGIRLLCNMLTNFYATNFQEVLLAGEETMALLKDSKYQDLYGISCMIFGANNRSLGNFDLAVDFLLKGSEVISEEGSLAIYKCYSYYQLGEINNYINDYESAEVYYRKAVKLAEKLKNLPGLFRTYNGLANFYLSTKNYEASKKYLDLSLGVKGLSSSQQARTKCDLGIYYYEVNDFETAEKLLQENYNIRVDANLIDASSTSLIALSRAQIQLEKYSQAIENLHTAVGIAERFNSKFKIMQCYQLLSEAYQKTGQWEDAVKSFQKYDKLQINQAKKQLQNIYQIKNKEIKKQKNIIEGIYNEVQDSIRYAKRIQSAILPSENSIKELLPNSFIIYKPKDIVAGDFYWLEHKNDTVLFAVADCTGHGVPGAMVSVICNNALNRSVREHGLTEPGEILNKTRKIVVQQFEKSVEDVKDGMDIALCSIKGNILQYAGANNPLWIIRNNNILETKANKQPIGKSDHSTSFLSHQFKLEKNDAIYIFSDGFVDQFGGEKGKKFKAKAFKELLLSVQDKAMKEQKQIIDKVFESWKGNLEQVDDVCVIGLKYS